MTLADKLARLAAGERPDGDWLLGTAAMTGAAGDIYGEEAIVAAFRSCPQALGGTAVITPRGIALFGSDAAVVADVFDGHVARLWRVGAADATAERRVAVAFDPDLAQRRGDMLVDPDAVDLDPDRLAPLTAFVATMVRGASGDAFRRRAFVIRAFADNRATAGLVAMYTASPAGVGFHYLALALVGDVATMVTETPPARPWVPRV